MKTIERNGPCRICRKEHGLTSKEALRRQARTPLKLAAAFQGVSSDRATRRPKPKKWSMREILVHLRDCEIVYGARIRKMIAEAGGMLIPFDQDRWAGGLRYRREDTRLTLESFSALRKANLALLASIGPRALDGHGIHPEYGRLTVRDLVLHWAYHDDNHLSQLESLRRPRVASPSRR